MNWSADTYEQFAEDRLAPLKELLGAVEMNTPHSVVDLGCGSGAAIPYIQDKWPDSQILAIDNDPEMLMALRKRHGNIDVLQRSIWDWCHDDKAQYDLVFSNAALHWVKDHKRLILSLLQKLKVDGVLAIQVPNNWKAPAHRAMFEMLAQQNGCDAAKHRVNEMPLLEIPEYEDLLNQHASTHRIWQITYTHMLEGDDAVLKWLKGSTLGVILSALEPLDARAFERQLATKLSHAYPKNNAGVTPFEFRRLFMLAKA